MGQTSGYPNLMQLPARSATFPLLTNSICFGAIHAFIRKCAARTFGATTSQHQGRAISIGKIEAHRFKINIKIPRKCDKHRKQLTGSSVQTARNGSGLEKLKLANKYHDRFPVIGLTGLKKKVWPRSRSCCISTFTSSAQAEVR